MKKTFITALLLLAAILGGCSGKSPFPCMTCPNKDKALSVLKANYTQTPVKIDGKLDDDAWKNAVVYQLYLSEDQIDNGRTLEEPGEVQLAWDDRYFYVGVKYYDTDIVAEGKEDQEHHYKLGDICEVFLKNDNFTWYWELYGTPAGKKSNFFFPGWGRLGLPSMEEYESGLKVASEVKGTLNNWKDKDEYYTVELAMPIKDLTDLGGSFDPNTSWRILVARYNYSRYFDKAGAELSMTPQLPATNYHLINNYAILKLVK